ncbi:MAG: hypothetical protein MJ149_03135, partial [Clostridia bacterium]|nr:hypothetical protein [Clostridia bacterium]
AYGTTVGQEMNLNSLLSLKSELRPVLLLDNCIIENWDYTSYKKLKFSVSTLTATEYYIIVLEAGEAKIVNEGTYVAPTPKDYVLYPINRQESLF